MTKEGRQADARQLGRLALRLFDSDLDGYGPETGGAPSPEDLSVDDVPVLEGDVPLEMDILVHLLMR